MFGWLLIIQCGAGFVSGLFSVALLSGSISGNLAALLGPLSQGTDLAAIDRLVSQLRVLNLVQIGLCGVVAAGAVGLLLRQKWGWYVTTGVHALEVPAALLFGIPALRPVLALLDSSRAGYLSVVISALIALIPGSIAGFMMLTPVVRQFETNVEHDQQDG